MVSGSNIIGPSNFYHQQVVDSVVLAQAAIDKYFYDPREPVVILADFPDEQKMNDLHKYLQGHYSASRKVLYLPLFEDGNQDFEGIVEQFLSRPEGILIAHPDTFHGVQARNTIIFSSTENISRLRNIILRTISFTVIITTEESRFKETRGLIEDKNLHEFIRTIQSYHHHNNLLQVPLSTLTIQVIDKYFNGILEEDIVFLTFEDDQAKDIYEALNERFLSITNKDQDRSKDMLQLDTIGFHNVSNQGSMSYQESLSSGFYSYQESLSSGSSGYHGYEESLSSGSSGYQGYPDLSSGFPRNSDFDTESVGSNYQSEMSQDIDKMEEKRAKEITKFVGNVCVAKVETNNIDAFSTFLFHSFVIFIKREQGLEAMKNCIYMLLRARPKFALVIHDGCIDEFEKYFNMIEDTDLSE